MSTVLVAITSNKKYRFSTVSKYLQASIHSNVHGGVNTLFLVPRCTFRKPSRDSYTYICMYKNTVCCSWVHVVIVWGMYGVCLVTTYRHCDFAGEARGVLFNACQQTVWVARWLLSVMMEACYSHLWLHAICICWLWCMTRILEYVLTRSVY